MGQGFNFKFDELREGNPTEKEAQKNANEIYAENSHVRNLCLVWPDGKRKFLNYGYLVSGEYIPTEGTVILSFTSEIVTIKGSGLEILFGELMLQLSKYVVCTEARYRQVERTEKFIVEEINIIIPSN